MTESCLNATSPNTLGGDFQKEDSFMLQEPVESMGVSNANLSEHIYALITRCANALQISPDGLGANESTDPTHIFTVLKHHLEQLIQAYTTSNQQVKAVKDENNKIKAENAAKIKLISEIECRMSACKKQLEMLRCGNCILEQRNETFRKQSEKYKRDVRRLNKDQSKTKSNLDSLQRQYEQTKRVYEETVNQLTSENSTIEAKLSGIRSEVKKLSEEKSKLEKNHKSCDQRISELISELQDKTSKIDQLEEINERLLATVGLHIDETRAQNINEEPNNELSNLSASVTSKERISCEDQPADTLSQTKRFNQLTNEMDKLNQYLTQLEAELAEKTLTARELETKLAASEKKATELTNELSRLKHDHDLLKHENKKLQSSLSESQLQSQKFRDLLENAKSDSILSQEKLCQENKFLEQNVEQLMSKVSKFENGIRSIFKLAFTTQDSGRGDEVHPTESEDPMQYMQERINALVHSNRHLTKTGNELRNIVCELKSQLNEVQRSRDETKAFCDKLRVEMAGSEFKIQNLGAENFSLSSTVFKLSKKIEELEMINQQIVQETTQREISRDKEMSATIQELQNEIETRIKAVTDIENKIVEMENCILELRDKLFATKKQLDESNGLIETLKQEKQQLNQELQTLSDIISKQNIEVVALQTENTNFYAEVGKLTRELGKTTELQVELELANEHIASLTKDARENERVRQVDLNEISRLNMVLESLRPTKEDTEEIALGRVEKIKDLEDQVLDLHIQLSESENKIQGWQQALQETGLGCNDLSVSYGVNIHVLEERVELLERDKALLETTNKDLLDNLIKLGNILRQAQSVNVDLLSQLERGTKNSERDSEYLNLQLKYVTICAEKERLEAVRNHLESNCEKMSKRIEILTSQLASLQDSATMLERCNSQSRIEIDTLRKTFSRNRLQGDDLNSKFNAIQRQLRTVSVEKSNLERLYEQETATTTALKDEVAQLRERISQIYPEYEKDVEVANENTSTLEKRYDAEVAKNSSLTLEVQTLQIQLDSKQMELNDQTDFLNEVRKDLEDKLDVITKLSAELFSAKRNNENLQEENLFLANKVKFLSSIEHKLKRTQQTIDALATESSTLKSQIKELIVAKESLKNNSLHVASVKHELELKVDKLSSCLGKMSAAFENIQRENIELNHENAELMESVKNLQDVCAKTSDKNQETDTLEIEAKLVQDNYDRLLENVNQLRSYNQTLQDNNARIASDLDASRKEKHQLESKVTELFENQRNLEIQNIDLCNKIREMSESYEAVCSQRNALEAENAKILASFRRMESQQDELVDHHIASYAEITTKLLDYEQLKDRLQSLEIEKSAREKEMLNQYEQIELYDRKLKSSHDQVCKERELNKRFRRDIAIFQAKLIKSRKIAEEHEKQWEWERSKLTTRIQAMEKHIKANSLELRNRFENMKNKTTQCSTLSLTTLKMLETMLRKDDNATEACAALHILTQSELQIDSFTPSDLMDWKRKCLKLIKYPFVTVVFNMILAVFLKYALSRNNLEVIVRRTVPSML